jgi:Leucine-rich repeat (LRR) protein
MKTYDFSSIEGLKDLIELTIDTQKISKLPDFTKLPQLKKVILKSAETMRISEKDLKALEELKHLKELSIEGYPQNNRFLASRIDQLLYDRSGHIEEVIENPIKEKLVSSPSLNGSLGLLLDKPEVDDKMFGERLRSTGDSIVTLNLRGTTVTSLEPIKGLKSLKNVSLIDNDRLTDFSPLIALKDTLEEVILVSNHIDDSSAIIECLAEAPRLTSLTIKGPAFAIEDELCMAYYRLLKEKITVNKFDCEPLRMLNFANKGLDDEGLKKELLWRLPDDDTKRLIEQVYIQNNNITDLSFLEDLPNLQKLDVSNNNINIELLKAFLLKKNLDFVNIVGNSSALPINKNVVIPAQQSWWTKAWNKIKEYKNWLIGGTIAASTAYLVYKHKMAPKPE